MKTGFVLETKEGFSNKDPEDITGLTKKFREAFV
jgi:hypothetical protein